jgi:hypothetical protein
MKLTHRKLKVALVATILLGTALWIATNNARSRRAVSKYKARLLAAGEKLEVNEMRPPFVPDRQNSANALREVFALLNKKPGLLDTNPPRAMRMVAPGKAMVGWSQPVMQDQSTNTWDEIQNAVEAEQNTLALLQGLVERPAVNFNLDYMQYYSLLLPHLSPMKRASQLLATAALCDLHRTDPASATVRIRTILALAKGVQGDRIVISDLVSISIAHIGMSATWEVLYGPTPALKDLEDLQRDFEALNFAAAMEQALAMERALGEAMTAELRQSSEGYAKITGSMGGSGPNRGRTFFSGDWLGAMQGAWEQTRMSAKQTMWRFSWSYPDEMRALRGYQVLLESLRTAQSTYAYKPAIGAQKQRLKELGILKGEPDTNEMPIRFDEIDTRFIVSQGVEALDRVIHRVLAAEATRQLVVTAIAIKRYQARHSALPATLADLTPELLRVVPRDPVDGNPLRYRKADEKSFVLYSIGGNGIDEGGDATPEKSRMTNSSPWFQGKDIVWPSPASPAEIRSFSDNQLKNRFGVAPVPVPPAWQSNVSSTNSSN